MVAGHIWECDIEYNAAATLAGTYTGTIVYGHPGSAFDYQAWGTETGGLGGSRAFCCEITDQTNIDRVVLLGTGLDDMLSFQYDDGGGSYDLSHHGGGGIAAVEGQASGRPDDDTITGSRDTNANYLDRLVGNGGVDFIDGDDGDDVIEGHGGVDTLVGGAGDDNIRGNEGNDFMNGDAGDDVLNGDEDNDIVCGGTGSDTLSGYTGVDKLYDVSGTAQPANGGPGDDWCDDAANLTKTNCEYTGYDGVDCP